jgi:hypothetical protein
MISYDIDREGESKPGTQILRDTFTPATSHVAGNKDIKKAQQV